MARNPISNSFSNLLLRQNPRTIQNPNHQIRKIGVSGGEEFPHNQSKPNSQNHHNHQKIVEIAKEVSRIIRTRPKWEQTLVSDYPNFDLFDPGFISEVFKHQKNAFLSLRFFYWVSSHRGFSPDQISCDVMFNGLVEAKAVNAAKIFLEFTAFMPEPASLESYIACLCDGGLVEEALDVFEHLKVVGACPSLATWNLALLGSVRAGRTDLVWKLYGEMMECGVVSDVDTVGYLIEAFCLDSKVSKGYDLLRQVLEAGYVPSNNAFNKLISGFCKDGYHSRVSAILHTMIAKNCAPDVFTYQEIINGLCKRRMNSEGFRIFNELKDRGYAPDAVMYTTMIHGLCKMKWLGDARKLWFEMIEKGMVPNEHTYNALIHGFCIVGNLEEAQHLYKEMLSRGYGETTVSYNTMISGLCSHGRAAEAHDLYKEMSQKGVAHDLTTYNSLIQGFCKEGNIAKGEKLLHELLEQGLKPSTASYTVLVEKLCEVGRVHEAITLWNDMQDRGVEPAARTHDFIITGLNKEGYFTEGIEWLANMLQSTLVPRKETFERLIQGLSQRDKLEDALLVVECMFKAGTGVVHLVKVAFREAVIGSLVVSAVHLSQPGNIEPEVDCSSSSVRQSYRRVSMETGFAKLVDDPIKNGLKITE
ncbi:hypothetical protein RJ640_016382 [Escallonia rubra]|uniref:Pentatricopeptide repeat-containing protein n=1 Tax=Escallonia rubra TaxID=112253 RepID=A0AA88R500_9ASTE|nr:hypothetical protein RJ640_016382 [Escallonia rubra]